MIDPFDAKSDVLHSGPSDSAMKKRKEQLSIITELFESNDISYKIQFEHGAPNKTVVNVANEGQHDIIGLGSRRLNSLQEMVMGSVSHKVAKRSNISVLIVK